MLKNRHILNVCAVLLVFAACKNTPADSASSASQVNPVRKKAASAAAAQGAKTAPKDRVKSVPSVEKGKFNVAFVYVGPVGDGGWTYAHDQGRRFLEKNLDAVHTAYVESVSEGADASQVIRGLARKGFDLIVTTSFGFMDATEQVAAEFPQTKFVQVSGFLSNGKNFGNLFGEMESMKYLAGMIAGARAKADHKKLIGYIAPFPIPEVIRMGNALTLGVRKTCPDCLVSIRWIHTWFDPAREKEAAESLLAEGADVVVTGADSTGPLVAAADRGRWSIGYDSANACQASPKRCLTTPYWNWGPVYVDIVKKIRAGTWTGGNDYRGVESGVVGLSGFMPGEKPAAGVPAEVLPQVQKILQKMRAGTFTRFDIFKAPIKDSSGKTVVTAGQKLSQSDLEGIKGVVGRTDCSFCMSFLVEGIKGRLPSK